MPFVDKIVTGMSRISASRPMEALCNAFEKNPEGVLGAATVTSIVLKDGIGCAMYVTQSLHNKKIPEEKRKFVAALDLTNGGLMILAQIAMFFAMRRYSGPIFKKFFAKSFNNIAKSETVLRMQMAATKAGRGWAKALKLEKVVDKVEKNGKDLFKFVADIAAATIIGKRVIVPLIATPLANKVKNWMDKKDSKSANAKNPEAAKETPAKQETKQIAAPAPEVHKLDTGSTNLLDKYRQK
jgi:hypothetical protein